MKFSNKSELYKPFFLLTKIAGVLSCILIFKLAIEMLEAGPSLTLIIPMFISGLLWTVVQISAAHYAEKMIDNDNSLGLIIGVILALIYLPTMFFPLSLFGIYAFFSKAFRENKLILDRPLWLSSLNDQVEKWTSPKQA